MRRLVVTLAVLCLSAAGCADGAERAAPEQPTEPGGAGEVAGQIQATTLAVGTTALGDTLLDGTGRAVYAFDRDGGGASACVEGCAANWPPLLVEGEPVAGEAVDPALLGTTTRSDGTRQVTYGGRPLYHFAGDEFPGDVKGHGLDEQWWLLRPDGTAIPTSDVGMGY